MADLAQSMIANSTSVSTLPRFDSNTHMESVVPPLPSLFEEANVGAAADKNKHRALCDGTSALASNTPHVESTTDSAQLSTRNPPTDEKTDQLALNVPDSVRSENSQINTKQNAAKNESGEAELPTSELAPQDPAQVHVEVFDSPGEEHDFVSTILETSESMDNLTVVHS
jgi:hypothetical protein